MADDENERPQRGFSGPAMISRSLVRSQRQWRVISFPSTLHLHPVLDILLSQVPNAQQAEVRLGLQEALVNAAKHGNDLNPQKLVLVRYHRFAHHSCWIIEDQGPGFSPPDSGCEDFADILPCHSRSCGRGLFILHQVFDEVQWNDDGTALTLHKRHEPAPLLALAGCVG